MKRFLCAVALLAGFACQVVVIYSVTPQIAQAGDKDDGGGCNGCAK